MVVRLEDCLPAGTRPIAPGKYTDKKATTHADPKPKQNWKLDRYAQRDAKVSARRNITGGF
jgi:hypothetical protein